MSYPPPLRRRSWLRRHWVLTILITLTLLTAAIIFVWAGWRVFSHHLDCALEGRDPCPPTPSIHNSESGTVSGTGNGTGAPRSRPVLVGQAVQQ